MADCLRPALEARNSRYPLAFTYHSSQQHAWEAVGIALDRLDLRITALWPVRTDGHMGPHRRPGNCEWDIVIVCRPTTETHSTCLASADGFWQQSLGTLAVGAADLASFGFAYAMASNRFGKLPTEDPDSLPQEELDGRH